jgi:hypothetical protein
LRGSVAQLVEQRTPGRFAGGLGRAPEALQPPLEKTDFGSGLGELPPQIIGLRIAHGTIRPLAI